MIPDGNLYLHKEIRNTRNGNFMSNYKSLQAIIVSNKICLNKLFKQMYYGAYNIYKSKMYEHNRPKIKRGEMF